MMIPDFDDIVFEGLNKEYGAYPLRKKYNRVLSLSVILAVILGCTLVVVPYIKVIKQKPEEIYTLRYVSMENLELPEEQTRVPHLPVSSVLPQGRASAKLISSGVRYIAPVIVDSVLAVENTIVPISDLISEDIMGQGIRDGFEDGKEILSGAGEDEGNGLYSNVDIMPLFKGGDIDKFREWIQKKTKYPQTASANEIQGKVYITFIIEKDGSLTNAKVVRGVDPLIDNEALKAVMSSPNWTPGWHNGKAVRVSYFISVNFEL